MDLKKLNLLCLFGLSLKPVFANDTVIFPFKSDQWWPKKSDHFYQDYVQITDTLGRREKRQQIIKREEWEEKKLRLQKQNRR